MKGVRWGRLEPARASAKRSEPCPEGPHAARSRGGGQAQARPTFRRSAALASALLVLVQCGSPSAVEAQAPTAVRPAAVAGSFYPADPAELAKTVDSLIASAKQPPLDAIALVAPHAGYEFAGPVAAYTYASLKGRKIDRVIVIAPSHYEAFGFSSVYDGAAYTTPLGRVPVDHAFAAKLVSGARTIRLSSLGHQATRDKPEHSIEVQLPYLQRVLGNFELVPIVMGNQSYQNCRELGLAIAKLLKGTTGTLILASSDLRHYLSYDENVKADRKTLNALAEYDYLSMSRNFASGAWEACGGGPIIAAMIAAERLGATEARVLKYANSGDVPGGDKSRVVGYGAAAFLKSEGKADAERPFTLDAREKAELMAIARRSVESIVRDRKQYQPPAPASQALAQERGAFVTLKERGQLRGCIGYVAPTKPLYLTVRDVAQFAATEDNRFHAVAPGELGMLQYEISVLSPMRHVLDTKEIVIGQHGLLLRNGGNEGVFLPQVPVEEKWNLNTYLQQLGFKAGLNGDAWRDPGTDLFRYTAVIFGEGR
jgi:AmmeMemoRadiSam system protein B/AmmeMemoRadiSam system protein A